MDISYLGKDSYKIKTKAGSVQMKDSQLTVSHKSGGDDFSVVDPGEYEVEGISVFGYPSDENTVFVIQFEDFRVLYLGTLHKMMSEKTIAELENIDVVIVGVDGLSNKELTEIVAKLEPYYVLPFGDNTEKFINAYEHGSRSVKSLNLSKLSLSEDLTEVIVFE